MHVLGTAGHVDHGKTSLLRFLTGMEPSRLDEEKRRGMTIQLGFVWMTGPDGTPVGFVDVPGHKDFRATMMTGVSGIDGFIFIVAADDGWMEQSEEHLWTLKTLGVKSGLVAISKTDLVTSERVAEVKNDAEYRMFEALGFEIPAVTFSAETKSGGEELKKSIHDLILTLPKNLDLGRPYLFLDRAFTLPGQGTIVTGTLRDGSLQEKERVEILPIKKTSTVRSIQCYGKKVSTASPTTRIALQISDVSKEDFSKGCQLSLAGKSSLTSHVDLKVHLFNENKGVKVSKLSRQGSRHVLVIHGGIKTSGKMVFAGQVEDGCCFLRIHLSVPRWVRFGDHMLVLSPGADRIVAGGRVADNMPQKGLIKALAQLKGISAFTLSEYLGVNLKKHAWVEQDRIVRETTFSLDALRQLIDQDKDRYIVGPGWIAEKKTLEGLSKRLIDALDQFHLKSPETEGLTQQSLSETLKIPLDVTGYLAGVLIGQKQVVQSGSVFRKITHKPRFEKVDSVLKKKLDEVANSKELLSHSIDSLGILKGPSRLFLDRYFQEKKLVRLGEDHIMSRSLFDETAGKILTFIKQRGEVTAGDIRDHIGVGRKLTIMLLEAMDREKLTLRSGEKRRVL